MQYALEIFYLLSLLPSSRQPHAGLFLQTQTLYIYTYSLSLLLIFNPFPSRATISILIPLTISTSSRFSPKSLYSCMCPTLLREDIRIFPYTSASRERSLNGTNKIHALFETVATSDDVLVDDITFRARIPIQNITPYEQDPRVVYSTDERPST